MRLTPAIIVLLASAVAGRAQDARKDVPETGPERLESMKTAMKPYEFAGAEEIASLRLQAEPAFRLGGQGNDILEGAIFFWNDNVGRPGVAAQVTLNRQPGTSRRYWCHEFTSLLQAPFVASDAGVRVWSPRSPGVVFKPIAGAPRPAETVAQRTRQLRALAQEFKGNDEFGEQGLTELRLLPTPIARYGKPASPVVDGALFALVIGTDPEVFLFLEERTRDGVSEWQYALAPMTCYALKVSRKGETIWELPRRGSDANTAFFQRIIVP